MWLIENPKVKWPTFKLLAHTLTSRTFTQILASTEENDDTTTLSWNITDRYIAIALYCCQ